MTDTMLDPSELDQAANGRFFITLGQEVPAKIDVDGRFPTFDSFHQFSEHFSKTNEDILPQKCGLVIKVQMDGSGILEPYSRALGNGSQIELVYDEASADGTVWQLSTKLPRGHSLLEFSLPVLPEWGDSSAIYQVRIGKDNDLRGYILGPYIDNKRGVVELGSEQTYQVANTITDLAQSKLCIEAINLKREIREKALKELARVVTEQTLPMLSTDRTTKHIPAGPREINKSVSSRAAWLSLHSGFLATSALNIHAQHTPDTATVLLSSIK